MKTKPLSCTRGMHFYRKDGKNDVCMYCGDIGFVTMELSNGNVCTFKPCRLWTGKIKVKNTDYIFGVDPY